LHIPLCLIQVEAAAGMAEGDKVVRRVREIAVERSPEPLSAEEVFTNKQVEDLLIVTFLLAGNGFEYLLNHFGVSELVL
jgi:cytochrome b involved in lipid metabolism